MRAVRYAAFGGPEVLQVVEVDPPHAGPGQIRIVVHAAGVNPVDAKIRSGAMNPDATLPAGSGLDAAGVVDEVGEGVDTVAVGTAVFGSGTDTYAERAVLAAWAAMPTGLGFPEAAGWPVPVETAARTLSLLGLDRGQTLLVSGASGGVGSAVLQIARERGLHVVATASAANQGYLTSLGATATTYGDGLVERVRRLSPDGVDAALDIAGSGVLPELIELTGDPTSVLSIADFSAPEHGARVTTTPQDPATAYAEAARLFSAGRFSIPVQESFPLEQAGDAHAAVAARHARGRFVLAVQP